MEKGDDFFLDVFYWLCTKGPGSRLREEVIEVDLEEEQEEERKRGNRKDCVNSNPLPCMHSGGRWTRIHVGML